MESVKKKKTNSRRNFKSKDLRVNIIQDIKKGRVELGYLKGYLKYTSSKPDREYILSKVGKKYTTEVYSYPHPSTASELAAFSNVISDAPTIESELKWYFESIDFYIEDIIKYINLKEQLECNILKGENEKVLDILDELEDTQGLSYFLIQTDFYLNEIQGNTSNNKELIKEYSMDGASGKLLLALEYARLRIEKKTSTWQYNVILQQNRKNYADEEAEGYISFKLDPSYYDVEVSNLHLVLNIDSDFSISDRYETLKKVIPLILLIKDKMLEDYLLEQAIYLYKKTKDKYWEKLSMLLGSSSYLKSDRDAVYNKIHDAFILGKWKSVIDQSKIAFLSNPNYSELYIPFVKSLILTDSSIDEYFESGSELHSVLSLLKSVLEKKESYQSDKEKLLKKYYETAQFNFSNAILEFIQNESKIGTPHLINLDSYLNSSVYKPNYTRVINCTTTLKNILDILEKESLTNELLSGYINKEIDSNAHKTFLIKQLEIGALFNSREYEKILGLLKDFRNYYPSLLTYEFIYTWVVKNYLICYQKLKQHDKAAGLVVKYYFEKSNIYDHFFQQDLVEDLISLDGETIYQDICIPILFQLFNQPQSIVYDGIANFLIQNDVSTPSELIECSQQFEIEKLVFFFEKVCIMDNIESSPFMNTIEALEEERIKILNFLKEVNAAKKEIYNEEILEIVKQASIRKGLQQIHESRIFVDTQNIEKKVESELKEIFERYLELTDIKYIDVSTLSLEKLKELREIKTTFYLKEQVSERDFIRFYSFGAYYKKGQNENVVRVPYERFQYFVNLFNQIKNKFVFDEDFGFKSFLSMWIRHGTFPNVLRSVFENSHLVSSKPNHTTEYNDIDYWKVQLRLGDEEQINLQKLLKDFSGKVDDNIDLGLRWISVRTEEHGSSAMFDFEFFDLLYVFQNRVGRITDFKEFINEIFLILFERLEACLENLRGRITGTLSNNFVTILDNLQKGIESISSTSGDCNLLHEYIIKCRTDIQVKLQQVEKWFNVSKNKYIEEFPIDMILDTSTNYINSITGNALEKATINTVNNCELKFKGKYFESFGDIFINIFSNIIKYNKDLKEQLTIDIVINSQDDELSIYVKNNLSSNIDFEDLKNSVDEVNSKIENYKDGTIISYEDNSGYPKICKCIAVDLGRSKYVITPSCSPEFFEVNINFNTLNLSR